jgi:hypothetical protein
LRVSWGRLRASGLWYVYSLWARDGEDAMDPWLSEVVVGCQWKWLMLDGRFVKYCGVRRAQTVRRIDGDRHP